ncbi:MAG: shikimate kinase [Verrucomicrobiales bacterium]|nr:shikimate kinase [Verrucomicrobiales bacterium]
MTPTRELHHLALVGFMGSGKSTVGRLVARHLGLGFVDTDEAIEARTSRRISEIFAADGEAAFRALERQTLEELVGREGLVIATGGGLICQPGNLEILQRRALVVCLWASADTIWERVRHQSHRPLLQVADPKSEIARLLTQREPFYRQADVLVNSGLRSLREVAGQVAHHYIEAKRAVGAP